jgi:hypothetical protein
MSSRKVAVRCHPYSAALGFHLPSHIMVASLPEVPSSGLSSFGSHFTSDTLVPNERDARNTRLVSR